MSFEQPRTISAYQFPKIYSVDFNWSKSEGRWPSLEMEHSASEIRKRSHQSDCSGKPRNSKTKQPSKTKNKAAVQSCSPGPRTT